MELGKEILLSWERCIKRGIAIQLATPRISLPRETFLNNDDNVRLISIFERAIESIIQFISTDYMLFLTGPDGILLSKTGTKETIKIVTRNEIEIGTCFSEESCGTNAISLAVRLKKPVYLAAEQHFCDFLKRWYCYAVPLEFGGEIKGYLDISTIEQAMKRELIAITKLLAEKIVNEYGVTVFSGKNAEVKLNSNQLTILKLIAKGLTTEAVALETGISVNTVKYHKKIVFRELGVQSTGEAVAKAINAGLI